MPVRCILACGLLLSSVAVHADKGHRYFPSAFDPHEKRSLAIAGLKALREPRLVPLVSVHSDDSWKPRLGISGKRIKLRIPF